jgi:hypothetical protein
MHILKNRHLPTAKIFHDGTDKRTVNILSPLNDDTTVYRFSFSVFSSA